MDGIPEVEAPATLAPSPQNSFPLLLKMAAEQYGFSTALLAPKPATRVCPKRWLTAFSSSFYPKLQ